MRVPVSRPRPPFSRRSPASDGALVGPLGLACELLLCAAHRGVRRPDAGLDLALLGAGAELEPAQLLARQRRLGVGVVLPAREQTPEEAGELARGGDDRDL